MSRKKIFPFPAERFDTFESVLKIDTASQRHLLHVGDEVEQVWAAWALGLKLGAHITPELVECLKTCRFPGTRRHFLVVLAGLGERETLEKYAVNDPAPLVRATACRYLARTAEPGNMRIGRFLLERLWEDASPEVREAILEELDRGKNGTGSGQE